MSITYEIVKDEDIECCRELCNNLMKFQQSKAHYRPELFDTMNFDTRMVPSVKNAKHNYTVVAKDGDQPVAYVYSNVSAKENYDNDFATFFDVSSVKNEYVGCLSNFYIEEGYRDRGIGTVLFNKSLNWLKDFPEVEDYFVFVSNGNAQALEFYKRKGFAYSNEVLDGFITTLRSSKQVLNRSVSISK
ncbi:GNAT family N-acetyltransferase [Pseudalkalibacillus berkeleyi]|uniref:GNAT family N-acetyltransferase n=1 Tax=Pseudalkalibacillus berkeleyi TaxID=1069813 RepID=A0ABS9H110_9BACL|nr:GNAT family N-acetyltransferase [Pseudalkalibacillus berkeleyi]MCF6137696.1 GNAT family N-acetyltransferase [Pseudalkalibacillus berkeleyi]